MQPAASGLRQAQPFPASGPATQLPALSAQIPAPGFQLPASHPAAATPNLHINQQLAAQGSRLVMDEHRALWLLPSSSQPPVAGSAAAGAMGSAAAAAEAFLRQQHDRLTPPAPHLFSNGSHCMGQRQQQAVASQQRASQHGASPADAGAQAAAGLPTGVWGAAEALFDAAGGWAATGVPRSMVIAAAIIKSGVVQGAEPLQVYRPPDTSLPQT